MPLVAIFGIDNDGINLAINLLILFLVVVYLALIVYTYLDAKRRIEDSVLIACATIASLFPFLGTIVYTILRPPEFLDDARERELEIRAAELRLRQLEESSCPNCEHPVARDWLRCPNCRARIKDPCESCGKPVDPRWTVCPYCETPTKAAKASPQRRPPRERESKAPPKRTAAARSERPKRPAAGSAEQRKARGKSKSQAREPVRRSSAAKPKPKRSGPGGDAAPAS